MLIGYARISKADGSQSLDLQRDALRGAGVSDDAIYEDQASGQREDRLGLAAFLKAARPGDGIVVWRLDRLGRNLRHLVNLVQDLNDREHRDPGARRPRGQPRHDDGQRKVGLRALRGFGGIRTRADPGTDPRWIGLCTSQGQEGEHYREALELLDEAEAAQAAAEAARSRAEAERRMADAERQRVEAQERTPSLGQIVVLRNTGGFYAAIQVLAIKNARRRDDRDELRFRYAIQSDGTDDFTEFVNLQPV